MNTTEPKTSNQTSKRIGYYPGHWWIVMLLLLTTGCTFTTERQPLEVKTVSPLKKKTVSQTNAVVTGPLKVLSLNMAHGRKEAMSQLFLSKDSIHDNLNDIADVLKQTEANLVALQEADGPSHWSGNFDHVAKLAQQAHYPWYARAGHAKGWLYNYGTALLSDTAFVDVIGHSFTPSPPTMTKGFILGQLSWQPNEHINNTIMIDVISVHLDFSRQQVRQQQIEEMTRVISQRNNPVIILGDFNSDWFADDQLIKGLVNQNDLRVYKPEATNLGTYHKTGRRLDWILISNELEFNRYTVLPDVISDHAAVIAEVTLKHTENLTKLQERFQ